MAVVWADPGGRIWRADGGVRDEPNDRPAYRCEESPNGATGTAERRDEYAGSEGCIGSWDGDLSGVRGRDRTDLPVCLPSSPRHFRYLSVLEALHPPRALRRRACGRDG